MHMSNLPLIHVTRADLGYELRAILPSDVAAYVTDGALSDAVALINAAIQAWNSRGGTHKIDLAVAAVEATVDAAETAKLAGGV